MSPEERMAMGRMLQAQEPQKQNDSFMFNDRYSTHPATTMVGQRQLDGGGGRFSYPTNRMMGDVMHGVGNVAGAFGLVADEPAMVAGGLVSHASGAHYNLQAEQQGAKSRGFDGLIERGRGNSPALAMRGYKVPNGGGN
jgi:hypothetical protein